MPRLTTANEGIEKMSWSNYQDLTRQKRDIVGAASTDAGNRSMRKAGRTTWNAEDWNTAVRELTRLLDN